MSSAASTVRDCSGIVAAAYDPFFGDAPYWEQAFCERRLCANGGAPKVACGTGRLPPPLARDGLAVEGPDTSRDMLDRSRAEARAMGPSPVLHQLPMQPFALPEHYRSEEFAARLAAAGFAGIATRRGYTEPESTAPDDDLVFSARRP